MNHAHSRHISPHPHFVVAALEPYCMSYENMPLNSLTAGRINDLSSKIKCILPLAYTQPIGIVNQTHP